MKSLHCSLPFIVLILCTSAFIQVTYALVASQPQAPKEDEVTVAGARAAIAKTYIAWGRARVELDKDAMDSMLAPDFYVSLYGRKLSREEFIGQISQERPGIRLTRFDTDVLTVQKTDEDWTAVISEKIEVTIQGSDGESRKMCSLWVTRDGWRKVGNKWLVTFSEAIGHENWGPGTPPPIQGW